MSVLEKSLLRGSVSKRRHDEANTVTISTMGCWWIEIELAIPGCCMPESCLGCGGTCWVWVLAVLFR